jgi:hypothetical protein
MAGKMRVLSCVPLEARTSDSAPPHTPAGRMWFCVILMTLPLSVVICLNTAASLFGK